MVLAFLPVARYWLARLRYEHACAAVVAQQEILTYGLRDLLLTERRRDELARDVTQAEREMILRPRPRF